MYYPDQLTAADILEHRGHALTVEHYGRASFPIGGESVAATIECDTCGVGLILEWASRESERV